MKTTIQIPFCAAAGVGGLDLELDTERNPGLSPFEPGVDVWIRAWTDDALPVRGASRGVLQVANLHLRCEIEEELDFAGSRTARLQQVPAEVVEHRWLGKGLGEVSFFGGETTVQASEEGYGILRVRYRAAYALLKLSGIVDAGRVIVWAEDGAGRKGHLVVGFGEASDEVDVYIVVKNYCTDLPVANAQVWVDGAYRGETDQFGRIHVGRQGRGTRHELRIEAQGFKSTSADALANDYYIVE